MKRRTRRSQRGMALAAMMLALLGVMSLILIGQIDSNLKRSNGLMNTNGNSTQITNSRLKATSAFNLAESGVEFTLQWLSQQAYPPNPNNDWSAFAPALWTSTATGTPARAVVTVQDANNATVGTFSVVLYPDVSNTSNLQKRYLIESVGTSNGTSQILRIVAQQKSFGGYSYFNDIEVANSYWVSGMNTFDGPMHSNNSTPNSAALTATNILWNVSALQMFTYMGADAYSCTSPSINWYKNNLSTHTAPSTNTDWLSIAAGGASSIQTGTTKIPLPTTSTAQLTAALGVAAVPAATGVIVPNSSGATNAGVYIHGVADNMVLSVDVSGNQVITITQHDATYSTITSTITLKEMSTPQQTVLGVSKTAVSNGAVTTSTSTYNGLTDGVIYADNNIGSAATLTTAGKGLSGVIADNVVDNTGMVTHYNALTIATVNTGSLYLNNNLVTKTARAKDASGNLISETADSNFVKNAGVLGLVANTIEVSDHKVDNTALNTVEVDAVTLAYNTFDADDYGSRPVGSFTLMGGYIAGSGGIFANLNSSGTITSGLVEHYHYDPRMADNPPPYFPTTGVVYDVVSWQRAGATLQ